MNPSRSAVKLTGDDLKTTRLSVPLLALEVTDTRRVRPAMKLPPLPPVGRGLPNEVGDDQDLSVWNSKAVGRCRTVREAPEKNPRIVTLVVGIETVIQRDMFTVGLAKVGQRLRIDGERKLRTGTTLLLTGWL